MQLEYSKDSAGMNYNYLVHTYYFGENITMPDKSINGFHLIRNQFAVGDFDDKS